MVIILFLLFIFYDKYRLETAHLRNDLFLEMKNYSLGFEDKRFSINTIDKNQKQKYYTLYEDSDHLYILTPITEGKKEKNIMMLTPSGFVLVPYSESDTKARKVWYPKRRYREDLAHLRHRLLWQFLLSALVALIISLLAAWYTLRPLRSSLRMLEDFIKDIIHDLNTPLTSIMLNLKMLETEKEEEEIGSIRTAAQTIEMLHHNLDAYLREQRQPGETFSLDEVISRYVTFFTPLYDYLGWDIQIEQWLLKTDKQAFERIIYNLLSNACKYNTGNGKITIITQNTQLVIRNSSYGVAHPERVFERFYKESERGLGIGLHIVDKLCRTTGIEKTFRVKDDEVTVVLECKHILASSL